MKNAKCSKFISLEGGEGCGKSSLAALLKARFAELGLPLTLSREPGGTKLGSAVRQIFVEPPANEAISTKTEMLLIGAARAHHVENLIAPHLEEGSWVIVDRYIDSTRVYQSDVFGNPEDMNRFLSLCVGDYVPKLTFVLDCPVDEANRRLMSRQGSEKLSRLDLREKEFHEQVRAKYLRLAELEPERIHLIDASRTEAEVFEQVWTVLVKTYQF